MKINAPTDNSILTAYDQRLAQFLSPDPFVQDPSNTQSYNRYAYCLNNPFKYTDPSGYLASNCGSQYNINDPSEYHDFGVSYYMDGVSVTGNVYHAYSGAGTVGYNGNVGFSGSGIGYCLLDFQYYQDISTITVQYNYSNYNSKGDDESFLTGGNVLPAAEVPIDRKYFYGSYTINRNFGPYSNQSKGNNFGSNYSDGSTVVSNSLFVATTTIDGAAAINRGNSIINVSNGSFSILRTYGTTGLKYVKICKSLGVIGSIVTTGYSAFNVGEQYNKGGVDEVVQHRDVLDMTVGAVGLGATTLAAIGIISNPVGWCIGIGVGVYCVGTMVYDIFKE